MKVRISCNISFETKIARVTNKVRYYTIVLVHVTQLYNITNVTFVFKFLNLNFKLVIIQYVCTFLLLWKLILKYMKETDVYYNLYLNKWDMYQILLKLYNDNKVNSNVTGIKLRGNDMICVIYTERFFDRSTEPGCSKNNKNLDR